MVGQTAGADSAAQPPAWGAPSSAGTGEVTADVVSSWGERGAQSKAVTTAKASGIREQSQMERELGTLGTIQGSDLQAIVTYLVVNIPEGRTPLLWQGRLSGPRLPPPH